jgi:SAM-dependent methyltransferase
MVLRMTRLRDAPKAVTLRARTYAHRVRYAGRNVWCPVCERSARRFAPHRGRPHARCPHCGSLERHRVLWMWLRDRVPPGAHVLHVAPEPGLAQRLQELSTNYLSVDLDSPHAMKHCDVTEIPEPDASFDVVICNHVLEHVSDDRKAMRELRRVLRPGGLAVLQHPVHDRPDTYEDASVVDPGARLRVFGQEDHVRIYGWDMLDRLREAGFADVAVPEPCDDYPPADRARYGLLPSPTIVATRRA